MSTSSSSNDTPSASSSSSPARATSQRWQSGRAYRTSREGIEAEVVGIRDRLGEAGGRGDHRGVVGAERDRNQLQPQPELVADRPGAVAELRVRGHPAAESDRGPLTRAGRALELCHQLVRDRPLERGGQVGAAALGLLRAEIPYAVDQRGLQAAEAEVETAPA